VIRSLVAAALIAVPSLAQAQAAAKLSPPPDICSSGLSAVVSRPTQTTAACVVKPNQVLIETGYQSQTIAAAGGSYTYQTYPLATIRIGTTLRNVELDVIPPSAIRSAGSSATSDIGAGLRWQIGSTPSFAYSLDAIATAPTGTDPAFNPNGLGSANGGTYTANANLQGTLGKVFGYGATLSVNSLTSVTAASAVRYTSVIPSFDLTLSLPSAYTLALEAYRQSNGEGSATPSHTWFDAALEKTIGNAQLDLSYGASNRISPAPGAPAVRRHYAGFGISYLL
jgi:hypothetical protein